MAQFSGPYTVVAGLLGGGGLGVGLDDFTDELAQDPRRRALMAKVDVVADDRCMRSSPPVPGHRDGADHRRREIVEEVLTNRGGPQRPLVVEELAMKFRDNVRAALRRGRRRGARPCAGLDQLPSVAPVLGPLAAFARIRPN